MMQLRLLGRALTVGLVLSAVGSCWTNAAAKGDPLGLVIKPPLVPASPPLEAARSKGVSENWKVRKAAMAQAGLSEVLLPGWLPKAEERREPHLPWTGYGPEVVCKVLENLPDAPPRLLYGPTDKFAVSADGKLHCLLLQDGPALGTKKESVTGAPPGCMGGAYPTPSVQYHLYVLPEDLQVGEVRTVRIPYYDLDIRYSEHCPMVPSSHPAGR